MPAMRQWLPIAAAGLVGLAVGIFMGRDRGGGDAAVPAAAVTSAASVPSDAAFTLDDVRRVVREELAARPAGGATPNTPSAASTPMADAAQEAAASRASATFEAALARRSWTDADSDALRDDFANMAPEQRAEWLRQFSMAVNQGRLVPESERSPF